MQRAASQRFYDNLTLLWTNRIRSLLFLLRSLEVGSPERFLLQTPELKYLDDLL